MSYSKDANIYFHKISLQIQYVWCTGRLLPGEIIHLLYLQDLLLRHNQEMLFPYKGAWVVIILTSRVCRTHKMSAAHVAQ